MTVQLQLNKNYKLGKLLGEGEFGQVFEVKSSECSKCSDKRWACKVVKKPSKSTKKGNSQPEIAHDRLFAEHLFYSNHFAKLRGTVLPKLPSTRDGLKSFYDEIQGYRCLVMERMECTMLDAIPKIAGDSTSAKAKAIEVGKIASKLIDLLQGIHGATHVLVDVKPENLMLCQTSNKYTAETVAESLRLVDLGLLKPYGGVSRHVPNETLSEINGTPLYASLHVHDHNTPSRRDDVESMLFVIGDFLLTLNGKLQKANPPYGSGNRASYLPWSQEATEKDIGTVKKQQVNDIKSGYYSQMPKPAAKIILDCFKMVHAYEFTSEPDYDKLRTMLRELSIPIPQAKSPSKSAAKAKSPARRSPRKTAARTALEASLNDDESPPSKRAAKSDGLCANGSDVEMKDASSEDESVEVMAVEEDSKPKNRRHTLVSGSNKGPTRAVIKVTSGPLKGSEVEMDERFHSSIVIGSAPTQGRHHLVVPGDDNVAPNHVQMDLVERKGVFSVQVTFLETGIKCWGTTDMEIGSTTLEIYYPSTGTDAANTTKGPSEQKPAPKPRGIARAILKVESGPDAGLEVVFSEGGCDCVIVGSKPTGKGHPLVLDDGSVGANHAKLVLTKTGKSVFAVEITDLSAGPTVVGGKLLAPGKSDMVWVTSGGVVKVGGTSIKIRRVT